MRQAGVSKSTVYRIKNEIGQTFQRLKPVKPSSITETTKNIIKLKLLSGKLRTAEDTHKFLINLGHPIGYQVTRKLQHCSGFNCHIKKKQPHLNVDHRRDRLKWAKTHRNWSFTDWKRVIFSDETKINLLESDGIQYIWKKEGGRPDQPHNSKETRRHQKSLIVWGCMTSLGVGYAFRVYDRTMKAVDYVHILSTTYNDTLAYYDLKNKDVVFLQDGDSKHTASLADKYMKKEKIFFFRLASSKSRSKSSKASLASRKDKAWRV
ncbi:hypothetical protein INT46_007571 [Mucor plumbeus]|uniref:Transposase Tc1-like domain-containing protein n=1 Tax=Mucor plumbeus TaxID=97098 RepID=A0A8H7QEK9_9FUNG|nr:hypothetical protein INT46_007571 [Mucor plumbeus]